MKTDFTSLPNIAVEWRVTPSYKKRHENNSRSSPDQICTFYENLMSDSYSSKMENCASKICRLKKINWDIYADENKTKSS